MIQKTLTLAVGLDPFPINDKLGNGTLAGPGHNFLGGARGIFDVDLFVREAMLLKKSLGHAAVRAPEG